MTLGWSPIAAPRKARVRARNIYGHACAVTVVREDNGRMVLHFHSSNEYTLVLTRPEYDKLVADLLELGAAT